jgi:hypothetical protein
VWGRADSLLIRRAICLWLGIDDLKHVAVNSRCSTVELKTADAIRQIYGAVNVSEGLSKGFDVHLGFIGVCRIIRHLGSAIGRIAGARDHKQDSFVSGEEWTKCFVAEMEKLSAPLLRLPS